MISLSWFCFVISSHQDEGHSSIIKIKIKNFGHSLNSLQLLVASITDSNIELEAHDWNIDSIYWTFITNGFATMTAMMLTNTWKWIHRFVLVNSYSKSNHQTNQFVVDPSLHVNSKRKVVYTIDMCLIRPTQAPLYA